MSSPAVRGVDVAMSRLEQEACFTWNGSHERTAKREKHRLEGPVTAHSVLQEPLSQTQSPTQRKRAVHDADLRTSTSCPAVRFAQSPSSTPSSAASSIGVLTKRTT